MNDTDTLASECECRYGCCHCQPEDYQQETLEADSDFETITLTLHKDVAAEIKRVAEARGISSAKQFLELMLLNMAEQGDL